MNGVTQILSQIEDGDGQAADKLLPLVYDELRKLAAAKIAQENPGQTLQATALVHEAYIRLVDVEKARHWDSRGHFFAAAAEAMREEKADSLPSDTTCRWLLISARNSTSMANSRASWLSRVTIQSRRCE
jgi:hypothetical protein